MVVADQNGLQLSDGDISNTITASCAEKTWSIDVPEFKDNKGSKSCLKSALYGFKTTSR
jgi:hypothetical protein